LGLEVKKSYEKVSALTFVDFQGWNKAERSPEKDGFRSFFALNSLVEISISSQSHKQQFLGKVNMPKERAKDRNGVFASFNIFHVCLQTLRGLKSVEVIEN
jgi:hypothetical protein